MLLGSELLNMQASVKNLVFFIIIYNNLLPNMYKVPWFCDTRYNIAYNISKEHEQGSPLSIDFIMLKCQNYFFKTLKLISKTKH